MTGSVTEQRGTGRRASSWRGGWAGAPLTLGFDGGRVSAWQSVYLQSPTLGVAYAGGRRGEGALAPGNTVPPALAPVRGLWLGQYRAFGEPEAGGRQVPAPRLQSVPLNKKRGAWGI